MFRKLSVRRFIYCVMCAVCLFGFTGCADTQIKDDGVVQVICTTFPAYDWARTIVGDASVNVEVSMLADSGTDMHSYQATATDIARLSGCDVLVYVGGESEKWLEDVLRDIPNQDMKTVCLMEMVGDDILEEEIVEGMQEHEHDHEEDEHDEHNHKENEYDEHVWLSLENAEVICEGIKNVICDVDTGNADIYEVNYRNYLTQLETLDEKYEKMVEGAKRKTIVFGDRFPFRYLVEDYELEYYAAFQGCSAETEASFETVAFLAEKLDKEQIPAILVIENSGQQIAQTIISNTAAKNQEILTINSMQSVSKEDVAAGVSYLSIMEENYQVLEKALNQ